MELNIVRADPAGNITIFVMNPPDDAESRAAAVSALLADPALKAEQVAFVTPGAPDALWTLEMMGGEFCGNASRSFGLLVAKKNGISGSAALKVAVSGVQRPLEVNVDTQTGNAEIEMPGPLSTGTIEFNGRIFPLYVFDGISHVIAEDMQGDEQTVRELIKIMDKSALAKTPALGLMFYDSEKRFMRPLVWTRAIDSLIWESSCGSGSAALGIWAARDIVEAETTTEIAQPGGTIMVSIVKRAGKIECLSISGKVHLSDVIRFRC